MWQKSFKTVKFHPRGAAKYGGGAHGTAVPGVRSTIMQNRLRRIPARHIHVTLFALALCICSVRTIDIRRARNSAHGQLLQEQQMAIALSQWEMVKEAGPFTTLWEGCGYA